MALKRVMSTVKRHWTLAICALALFGFACNVAIFHPGYMSNDSISHLRQAIGLQPVVDLTPPAMTAVWKGLITLTGQASAMLLLQLAMPWGALALLAIYIFRRTHSHRASSLILVVGILPYVLNISGVIWRDNQMAFCLLLAVALVLFARDYNGRKRQTMLALASIAVLYACLVRYNALPAILPMYYWIIAETGYIKGWRWRALATGAAAIVVGLTFVCVNIVMRTQQTHPLAALMIDDVINVSTMDDRRSMPRPLLATVESVSECSTEKKNAINNFWVCADDAQRQTLQYSSYQPLKSFWISMIVRNPINYALYKAEAYTAFLLPPAGYKFIWQEGIVGNDAGQNVSSPRLGSIVSLYVNNFGYKYFPYLFEPWFWLASCGILLYFGRNLVRYKSVVLVLALSSLAYLLSYLPTGATVDYRYVYWPALACTVGFYLMILDKRKATDKRK